MQELKQIADEMIRTHLESDDWYIHPDVMRGWVARLRALAVPQETRPQIAPGDLVIASSWEAPCTVKRIDTEAYGEPLAFFAEGGFWRLSELSKISALAVPESAALTDEPLMADEHGECPNCANPPHAGPCTRKRPRESAAPAMSAPEPGETK